MTIGHALAAFTVAAGLLTITPGLDTALVLRTAAVEGSRRAMLAGAGICLGCLTWGFAVAVGLGALLAVSRLAYDALRIVGACYLIVLGVRILLRKRPSAGVVESGDVSFLGNTRGPGSGWFARGFLTNVLNPKVGVFYVTFLPQFVPAGVSVAPFIMLLAAIHATEGMVWFTALTVATRSLSRWLRRPGVARTLDRVTGTILVGFGLELVLERRR
ncbi:MAG TPA: LysE family translocator [Gemmatimonadales bacterium]|nr:LysE family translocator [Gemmatimonadales bacterium]